MLDHNKHSLVKRGGRFEILAPQVVGIYPETGDRQRAHLVGASGHRIGIAGESSGQPETRLYSWDIFFMKKPPGAPPVTHAPMGVGEGPNRGRVGDRASGQGVELRNPFSL